MDPMCEHVKVFTHQRIHDSAQSVAVGVRRDEVDDEEIDIGDVIRANLLKLRRERGLSLEDLAKLSGVSQSTFEDLASGRSFPSIELLWKLARALDLPCTAFIEEPKVATLLSAQNAIRSTHA
jgi:ribosome-binding protein aMBF1 (putative translation factor)